MTHPTGPPGPEDPTRRTPWTDAPTGPAGPSPARPVPGGLPPTGASRPGGRDGPPPGPPMGPRPGSPRPEPTPSAGAQAPGGTAPAPRPPVGTWGPTAPPASPAAPSAVPPEPAGPVRSRRGPLRILGRALVVLLVIGALAGTTAWGLVNRASAEEWRDRSEAADARLQESLDRVETTTAEVEETRERLRDLAAENAGETDRNRILSDIVAQAPDVTAALRECQQETTALTNDVLSAFGDPAADVAALQRRIGVVNGLCEDALTEATTLEDSIDELGI